MNARLPIGVIVKLVELMQKYNILLFFSFFFPFFVIFLFCVIFI